MASSTRLSDTVHLLATVQIIRELSSRTVKDLKECLSSTAIAASIHTNPGYVRQLMMASSKAGLLICERGRANPMLARDAHNISLLDIYRAVAGEKPLLHLDANINPECNVGVSIQLALGDAYAEVQKCAENAMAKISLQDIIDDFYKRTGGNQIPD